MISLLCSCHWSGWLVICKPDTKAGGHGVTVGNNEREIESMRVCPGAGNIRLSLLVRMVPRAHGALIPFSLSTHFDQHSFFFNTIFTCESILNAFRISFILSCVFCFPSVLCCASLVPLLQFQTSAVHGTLQSSAWQNCSHSSAQTCE